MGLRKTNILTALLLTMTFACCLAFFVQHGKNAPTFYGDALGYYAYLPSTCIYDNLNAIEVLPDDQGIDSTVLDYFRSNEAYSRRSPKGHFIIQYTYGIALMESPFFFAAHAYEKWQGGHANGYNKTYGAFLKLSVFFYALLGFFFLYKSLRFFFNDTVSLCTLCLLLIGSNLFWFTLMQAGMSHVYLFCLYAGLIYTTIRVHNSPKRVYFVLIGFLCGFITVTRPSDVLCVLIPLLYMVYDNATLHEKMHLIRTNRSAMLLSFIFFFLPIIPQLIYWKMYTGHFLYNSYIDQSFHWLHPEIFKGLFWFSNGWLIYSPFMLFSIIGLFFYEKIKPFFLPLLVILPLYIYVIYSWWCYNYINGFGSRPMIHMYPLLAFPLAAFLADRSARKWHMKILSGIVMLFFIAVNLSYSDQAARGDLSSENSNLHFNVSTLFKRNITYQDLVTYDLDEFQPDENEVRCLKTIASLSLHDSVTGRPYYIVRKEEYPDIHTEINFSKKDFAGASFIRCEGLFLEPVYTVREGRSHLMVMEIKRGDSSLCWKGVYVNNKIGLRNLPPNDIHLSNLHPGVWDTVYFYMPLPDFLSVGDRISLSFLNLSKNECWIKEVKMSLYGKRLR